MAKDILASEESDHEEIQQLTINEHYAKAYEYKKEREELAKCMSSDSQYRVKIIMLL
jgi:protein KRI1